MGALAAAVRPFAGGIPCRGVAAPSSASERAPGKKRPRVGVAPARDSSACLTKMTRNSNSVVTAAGMEVLTVGGETSSQELLQKRLASELNALHGLVKKAELISRRGASKGGGAPAAGKKERFLATKQRPKPIEDAGGNAPSVKKMKISTLVEQKQKQIQVPRMLPEERNQLARRVSSLSGEIPGHIVDSLQKQFGEADAHGEIDINIDSVEDSVLFELKTRLDKFAEESKDEKVAEESKDEKVAEESKGKVVREQDEEYADISGGLPPITATSAQPPSEPASGMVQNGEAKKVQDVQRAVPKAGDMRGLIYKANVRRQLLEMEKAVLPKQSIHQQDLQRLCIAEYGRPSVMRHIGLVLKADA